jgi:hypothetical protein
MSLDEIKESVCAECFFSAPEIYNDSFTSCTVKTPFFISFDDMGEKLLLFMTEALRS